MAGLFPYGFGLAAILAGCGASTVPTGTYPSSCASAGTPAVLYVTHSAGFRHPVLGHSVDVLAQLGSNSGAFHLAWQDNASVAIDAADLSKCAALVFFTSGELPISDEQKSALLAFVSSGGGFVGLHSATDTLYVWPDYETLVGARFGGHPWYGPVRVNVVDPNNSATNGLPSPWPLNDEIYQFSDLLQAELSIALSLDTTSVDMTEIGIETHPWGFPLAWFHRYGQGQVFYTALGHGDIWDDAQYQAFVSQGIQSVLHK